MSDVEGDSPRFERARLRVEALLDRVPALDDIRQHQATRLLLAGVLIGALAGVVAGVFDHAIVLIGELLLGVGEPSLGVPSPVRALLSPALAGIVAAGTIAFATKRKRPQGVPDVLARVQMRDHPLSLRDGLVSGASAALVVGAGQSGGREGPIVQLAATLAAKVVGWLRIAPVHTRALVAAGGAAAVAASFNTPVAGAFFALEIILGNFALETFAPVIAATVTGTVVGQVMLGDRIALHLPAFKVNSAGELVLYALLGAGCGVVGALFKRAIARGGPLMDRLGLPVWARGGVAGLVVGCIAAAGLPAVMGNGYAFMELLIGHASEYGLGLLAILLVGKFVASVATASGRSGAGLFAPSLYVGAVAGTLCGELYQLVFPNLVTSPGAYGMVGMAAVASATLHAPITMTLMLFEMTRNYQVILPLLAAVATAALVSRLMQPESIYDRELKHQGIELGRGREELFMHDLRVADIMHDDGYEVVRSGTATGDIVSRFLSRRSDVLFVVDDAACFVGVIDIQDVKRYFAHPEDAPATGVPVRRVPVLSPDQRLSDALSAFFEAAVEDLPVVDGAGALVGVLSERDVVGAYNREVLRQAVPLTRVVQDGPHGRRTDFLELPPGEVLEVIDVSAWMEGRTLRDLSLPQRYACAVLAIRAPHPEGGAPIRRAALPDTVLAPGEELVVLGPTDVVHQLAAGEEPAEVMPPEKGEPAPVGEMPPKAEPPPPVEV